jgi:hypothetical protein
MTRRPTRRMSRRHEQRRLDHGWDGWEHSAGSAHTDSAPPASGQPAHERGGAGWGWGWESDGHVWPSPEEAVRETRRTHAPLWWRIWRWWK